MIQDIQPKVMHNEFQQGEAAAPDPGSIVFMFRGPEMYCRAQEDGTLEFPTAAMLTEGAGQCADGRDAEGAEAADVDTADIADIADRAADSLRSLIYLFRIDGQKFFLLLGESPTDLMEHMEKNSGGRGFGWESTRLLRKIRPKDLCFAGTTAYHLYVWYRDNRFCGRCGVPTRFKKDERALVCPKCGNTIYPKIAPAVIVGVMNRAHDKLLVTRYAHRAYRGDALIAGFCEIGETAEGTVRREVLEEAGIHVDHITYYKSQPWGFDSNLLLGFFAEADDSEPIHMDDGELAQAVWVDKDELSRDAGLSLTAEMMEYFREN